HAPPASPLYSLSLHDALPISVGGGYTISNCSGLSAANYTIGYSYGTLTVNPAGLTATVSGSQVYGGSPSYTAVYSGFVNGQNSRSEEHTSELQSRFDLVCRLL